MVVDEVKDIQLAKSTVRVSEGEELGGNGEAALSLEWSRASCSD